MQKTSLVKPEIIRNLTFELSIRLTVQILLFRQTIRTNKFGKCLQSDHEAYNYVGEPKRFRFLQMRQ